MRVMIIDDDVVSRMVLMHLVDSAGAFEVLEAEDGEDAWAQLQAGARPAIVFCDLRMPRLSGMELLARVKADAGLSGVPFVLVSAAGDAASMEQALGLGADGYIVKPFDSARVGEHLTRLVGDGIGVDSGADSVGDESPDATMRRLGIDATRLRLYLGGLQRQLAAAAQEFAQLQADGRAEAAQLALERLARLEEGCAMLGLHGAAAGLAALRTGAWSGPEGLPPRLDAVLAAARVAVSRRQEMLDGSAA